MYFLQRYVVEKSICTVVNKVISVKSALKGSDILLLLIVTMTRILVAFIIVKWFEYETADPQTYILHILADPRLRNTGVKNFESDIFTDEIV